VTLVLPAAGGAAERRVDSGAAPGMVEDPGRRTP